MNRLLDKVRLFGRTSLLLLSVLLVLPATSGWANDLVPEKQHPNVSRVVAKLFSSYHYAHQAVNDSVSSELFDFYLESLDPFRSFFLASDIARFGRHRYQFDEDLTNGVLDAGYEIYNTFVQRVNDRVAYSKKALEKEFDFNVDESYQPDRRNAAWASSTKELDELWRKLLKYEGLNLKLAGKDWPAIVTTLNERYANFQKRVEKNTSEEVFQAFLNSFAQAFDPHSNYLSPIDSENFGIQMSLSLQGIGAQLMSEADYTKVVRILPGGPADRSKQLWAEDKIVGVGQGENGEMVDVIGMRLDDVVQMIRGKQGTVVRLEVIPTASAPGAPNKFITLVRDKVMITDSEAKSDTVDFAHEGREYRLGVIKLPTFYSDMEAQNRGEENYKSTTRDVRQKIEELKKANIDGLVIDLRDNGGGALQEAIELTGLFIEEGPVVQVRNSDGSLKVLRDPDKSIVYDGPLVVLVNRHSASASEIFAAAIQDYGRGVVLGGQTFGKGTVQHLISLDQYLRDSQARLGQIKLTVAKFYRIAGGTTQHRGVLPDIMLPSIQSEMEIGESTEKNALPWDQIRATNFIRRDQVTQFIPTLKKKSDKRRDDDPEFRFLQEDIELFKADQAKEAVSLQESARRQERKEKEEERFKRENERRESRGLPTLEKGEDKPRNESTPDILLIESERVLSDLISMYRLSYHGQAH